MVKEPRAGRVKTRLGVDIGMTAAAWWYRHQVDRMIRRLNGPKWCLRLAIAPDTALRSSVWPIGVTRVAQRTGDLGQRMRRLFDVASPGPVLIVGGDVPALSARHITRAFDILGGSDAVFGPSLDGGFWLVGFGGAAPIPPGLFRNVRWSTADALADSIATLSGFRIAMTDTLGDVDEAADLSG